MRWCTFRSMAQPSSASLNIHSIGKQIDITKNDCLEKSMRRNEFWLLLFLGGWALLAIIVGPYNITSGRNTSPRYGKSRNDRIPPSYKQCVAIAATFFAIEAILAFTGIAFFDWLSDRARGVLGIAGMILIGVELVVCTVIFGIHEHREKRWRKITRGKKHFTRKELRAYEDLLYRRKRRDAKK